MPTDGAEIVVFLGPTLPRSAASRLLDATYLPPVQQGDVLAAMEGRPRAIVLIDGYFSWVPSVWHKEILWALSQGVAVYGAASMGALRAAELQPFGMIGHGAVFRDFAEGRLQDDDEVAVVHAPPDEGFGLLSDAMVNIRYTILAAQQAGAISPGGAASIIRMAKATYFPDRHLARLVGQAEREGVLSGQDAKDLGCWLPGNAVDIKRSDAESLLALLSREGPGPFVPDPTFSFPATVNWLELTNAVNPRPATDGLPAASRDRLQERTDYVLSECRLDGSWPELEALAMGRLLAIGPIPSRSAPSDAEYLGQLARLCIQLGVANLPDLVAWVQSAWRPEEFDRVVEREIAFDAARAYWSNDLPSVMRDILILTRRHDRLATRARQKREWLDSIGGQAALDGSDTAEAIAWFRERLEVPSSTPESILARENGWASDPDMREDVLSEYRFRSATQPARGARRTRPRQA